MKSEPTSPAPGDAASERRLTVGELACAGGVNRRTVRYYVQRGLIPEPHGRGRGSYYTQAHLDRLVRVRELQERRVPLAEIAARLDGASGDPPTSPQGSGASAGGSPEAEVWARLSVAPGLELHVQGGAPDREQLLRLAAFCESLLDRKL